MPPADITLTPKQHADWLTPSRAIEILEAVYGDLTLSKETMLEHLRAGIVQAVAETTAAESTRSMRGNFLPIPPRDWKEINAYDSLWKTGHLTYGFIDHHSAYLSKGTMRHFNVRFEPKSVHAIVKDVTPKPPKPAQIRPGAQAPGSRAAATSIEAPAVNKGGAPRKPWWDDFWIEICRQIYDNELKVEKQADLERAMLDWASANGHDMSETSAKTAARKLFKAWKLGDKN